MYSVYMLKIKCVKYCHSKYSKENISLNLSVTDFTLTFIPKMYKKYDIKENP